MAYLSRFLRCLPNPILSPLPKKPPCPLESWLEIRPGIAGTLLVSRDQGFAFDSHRSFGPGV